MHYEKNDKAVLRSTTTHAKNMARHRPTSVLIMSAIVVGSLLSGCSTPAPIPQDQFYRLSATTPRTGSAVLLNGTLAVARFQSDGLHNERALLYARANQPLRLSQYHYHYWTDPPTRLLQDFLTGCLRQGAVATTVANGESVRNPDFRLSGTINRFESILAGKQTRVVIDLDLALYKNDREAPLLIKNYQKEILAGDNSVYAAVDGYQKAMNGVCGDLVDDIRAQ